MAGLSFVMLHRRQSVAVQHITYLAALAALKIAWRVLERKDCLHSHKWLPKRSLILSRLWQIELPPRLHLGWSPRCLVLISKSDGQIAQTHCFLTLALVTH